MSCESQPVARPAARLGRSPEQLHARRDFPTRDDEKFLHHTLVWKEADGLRLDSKPVAITKWKPVERKY